MMKKNVAWFMAILIFGGMIYGCSPRMRYEKRLKAELASGERNDSLFMGLYLGMSDKDFYTQCWKLNRKGLIRQGSKNTTVEYEMRGELKHPATMNFYPVFVEGKIVEMPVEFVYKGWAPWNKKLNSDNLQEDVLRWYKKVYGSAFIRVKHSKNGNAYIKLDGNRRITLFKKDDMRVWAIFTDLLVEKELNDSTSATGKPIEDLTKDIE